MNFFILWLRKSVEERLSCSSHITAEPKLKLISFSVNPIALLVCEATGWSLVILVKIISVE